MGWTSQNIVDVFQLPLGDAPVLVTNSHVCSNNFLDKAPLTPENALVEFTRLPDWPVVKLGELLFSSTRAELDVSIIRIQPPIGSKCLEPLFYPPKPSGSDDRPQRIYVVGQPNGNELAVSMYDNSLENYEPPYVRYRSPTEPGILIDNCLRSQCTTEHLMIYKSMKEF